MLDVYGPVPSDVAWLPPAMLLAALLLDALFGAPAIAGRVPGLARFFARPALFLTKRLDRPTRTPQVLAVRGAIVAALLLGLATALGIAMHRLTHRWEGGLALELLLLSSGVALRRPFVAVRRALDKTKSAAEHASMRTAIEQTAGALESGLALPVAAYLLLGIAGFVIAVAARVIDRAVGGARPGERPFAAASHAAHRLLAAAPGHVLVLVLVLASIFVPGARHFSALREAWKSTGRDRPTLAAFAGILHVALGGPPRWSGRGTARVTASDLGRAFALYIAGVLVIVLALAVFVFADLQPRLIMLDRNEF